MRETAGHHGSTRCQMKKLTPLKCHGSPSRKSWRRTGAAGYKLSYFEIEIVLPTASGCHFQRAETSVCRRFWAALGRGNPSTARQRTTLVPEHPMNLRLWPYSQCGRPLVARVGSQALARRGGRFLGISCNTLTQPNEPQHLVPEISCISPAVRSFVRVCYPRRVTLHNTPICSP